MADYAATAEAEDPYCLRPGESERLLSGHPWRRMAIVGDSMAEGVGDPVAGYTPLGWAERVATELRRAQPALVWTNLGQRDLRAAQVAAAQLEPALAFQPDLALVACGGNDALRPGYNPSTVDAQVAAIISALQAAGADVLTVACVVMTDYPAFPPWFRPTAIASLRRLGEHLGQLSERLGTIHTNLVDHPSGRRPDELMSQDGLHANARSHAICAAEVIRRLGDHLGTQPSQR